jgi:hypothetical protein
MNVLDPPEWLKPGTVKATSTLAAVTEQDQVIAPTTVRLRLKRKVTRSRTVSKAMPPPMIQKEVKTRRRRGLSQSARRRALSQSGRGTAYLVEPRANPTSESKAFCEERVFRLKDEKRSQRLGTANDARSLEDASALVGICVFVFLDMCACAPTGIDLYWTCVCVCVSQLALIFMVFFFFFFFFF